MRTDRDDVLLAFLLGRAMAEQLGHSEASATNWGAIQASLGPSLPSMLIVRELAQRDAAAQAAAAGAAAQDPNSNRAIRDALDRLTLLVQRGGGPAPPAPGRPPSRRRGR